MKLYIARPGQTLAGGKGGEIPPRTPLTAIGRAAAAEIGKRLKAEGFGGRILAAPTRRAMETAASVAGVTGSSGGAEAALGGTEEEIRAYIKTGDCKDKAGGYGIQGAFGAYIKGIEGDYYNVVGLPIGRVYQELKKFKEKRREV